MQKKVIKQGRRKIIIWALAFASLFSISFTGCSSKYFHPRISSIEKQSTEVITQPDIEINRDIVIKGESPIYEKDYEILKIGDSRFLSYSPRNIAPNDLAKILTEQLGGVALSKVSVNKGLNQLLIGLRDTTETEKLRTMVNTLDTTAAEQTRLHYGLRETSETEKLRIDSLMGFIKSVDKPLPQIMLAVEIFEVYGDFTKDRAFSTSLSPLPGAKGFSPVVDMKEPGVLSSRVPDRLDMKNIIGVLYESDQRKFEAKLDMLRSHGFARTIIKSPIILENGKSAEIQTVQEFPYYEESIAGGAILRANKFKEVKNYVKILEAIIRADSRIAMNLELGTGTRVPTGSEQKYNIYTKTLKVESVEVGRGVQLVIAGFEYEIETGINRRMPFIISVENVIRRVPVVRELVDLVSSGHEYDTSRRRTFFLVTPYVVKTSQNADYSKTGMELKPMYKKDGAGILQFPTMEMQIPPLKD